VTNAIEGWDEAVRALREADEVVVACHVNPDGDALGSLFGASLGLHKLGKRVHASWGTTPAEVPASYSFLPGTDFLEQPRSLPEVDTFLAVDCGAADRLGELEERATRSRRLVNIDHHPGNDLFGTVNVVAVTASCTAELVAGLLADLGVEMDRDVATCLYVGVVTDTGRFQYSNSSPATLRLAADLLSHGVAAPAIAQEVFESSPFGYLKLTGRVLERARLFPDDRFVYSWVTQKDLDETGVAMSETDKLIDLVRSTRDADVAAIFKQQAADGFRVSLRSKGPNVGAIARARGGGGHDLAAGFSTANIEGAVEQIRVALRTKDAEAGATH
jgi:bifunctional oligoribonuclease and PAP phosphatase NrnA